MAYRFAMNAIAEAISKAGGPTKLGRALGITRQAVEQWKGRVVPPEHVLAIEKLTGVTRYELRPDIYGPPPTNPKHRASARAA
jgi:DNA-binding transcriptional regulator YdaS (Cro superfamily)